MIFLHVLPVFTGIYCVIMGETPENRRFNHPSKTPISEKTNKVI
jgi:hypothetical protein